MRVFQFQAKTVQNEAYIVNKFVSAIKQGMKKINRVTTGYTCKHTCAFSDIGRDIELKAYFALLNSQ